MAKKKLLSHNYLELQPLLLSTKWVNWFQAINSNFYNSIWRLLAKLHVNDIFGTRVTLFEVVVVRDEENTKTISDNLEMVEALFDDNANAEAKRDKPTLYALQFHDWKDPTLI